jgi:hypothetical protein
MPSRRRYRFTAPTQGDDLFDHLWLMIDASHNHAPSNCIGATVYFGAR